MYPISRKILGTTTAASISAAVLMLMPAAHADFVLDWSAANPNPTFPGPLDADQIEIDTFLVEGQTPFVYERVTINGQQYYHMIIGDGIGEDGLPSIENFGQEVYIRLSGQDVSGGDSFGTIGSSGSASSGNPDAFVGNVVDPLGSNRNLTGNASGNPQWVVMRQVVNDGELSQEFIKNQLLEKPSITTEINSDNMSAVVIIDSTGLTYNDGETASAVTNTLLITDPEIPEESASFDLANDARDSFISAGRYVYTTGSGPLGSSGEYTYTDGGGASTNPDWSSFFDHREDNPWAFDLNRP